MTKELIFGAIALFGSGFGTYKYLHVTFAEKEPVLVAETKVDFIMSRHEAALVRDITALEEAQRKRRLEAWEKDRLKELRQELKDMREVRKGK
jgi:hypothetical protein